jgi:hypothetical protein
MLEKKMGKAKVRDGKFGIRGKEDVKDGMGMGRFSWNEDSDNKDKNSKGTSSMMNGIFRVGKI